MGPATQTYRPGDVVVVRDIAEQAIFFAWPVEVVEDAERGLLTSQVPGAVGKVTRGYPSDPVMLLSEVMSGRPTLVDLAWSRTVTLGVFSPSAWWSTRLMWDAESGEFLCYYVDFRRPVRRNGCCLDTLDLGLDLVADRSGTWSWKDESHVEVARSIGWLDDHAESQLEAAKVEVVEALESGAFPFDGSLLDARPTVGTAPPTLPSGWDQSVSGAERP